MSIERVDSSNAMSFINPELLKAVEDSIKARHKKTQQKTTNKNHIKQKVGMDYVELSYMRNEADENYPLWSMTNLKFYPEFIATGWVMVQGELTWLEDGIVRKGSYATAHRIQFKTDHPRVAENIVDLGNDVKASVTDLLKKCFNTYLGISDDVYKNITIENLDDNQISYIKYILSKINPEYREKFNSVVNKSFSDGEINSVTFVSYYTRLIKQSSKFLNLSTGDSIKTYDEYISSMKIDR